MCIWTSFLLSSSSSLVSIQALLISGLLWSPSAGSGSLFPSCLSWDKKCYPCPTWKLLVAPHCWDCSLLIPWPHLTQVLQAGLGKGVGLALLTSTPAPPLPCTFQTGLSLVLYLLSAERPPFTLLSAHWPCLSGAGASRPRHWADFSVKFPFFVVLWEILTCFLCYLYTWMY